MTGEQDRGPGGTPLRRRRGIAAVDNIASLSGALIVSLGVAQIAFPLVAEPMTGLAASAAAHIIALQWVILGSLLLVGGLLRTRVVTIFAAEFVMISALATLAITFTRDPLLEPILIHAAILGLGLVNSGFARLTDKADLKRELRLMREQVALANEPRPNANGEHPHV